MKKGVVLIRIMSFEIFDFLVQYFLQISLMCDEIINEHVGEYPKTYPVSP